MKGELSKHTQKNGSRDDVCGGVCFFDVIIATMIRITPCLPQVTDASLMGLREIGTILEYRTKRAEGILPAW